MLKKLFLFLKHLGYTLGFLVWETGYILWKRPALLPHLWKLWEWSWFHSPYRNNPASGFPPTFDLTYGEIALPTLDKIFDQLQLSDRDSLVDLGSGRGRAVLLAAIRGIPAHGIECVSNLVDMARYAATPDLSLAQFIEGNFLTITLPKASIILAVGTCWSHDTRSRILPILLQLPPHTWVVSLSRPFQHPQIPVRQIIPGWTSWGRDHYYLQQISF